MHHVRMTVEALKAWLPLYSMIHPITFMSSHYCRSLADSDPAGWRKVAAGRGLRLPAGQGPWSSCLSHCQVSKTNSGQKHDTLGCESACEWQSLPLMEGKKCKSSPVTSKTCWTRFRTGLRSEKRRVARKPQAASCGSFPVCHKHLKYQHFI